MIDGLEDSGDAISRGPMVTGEIEDRNLILDLALRTQYVCVGCGG
jgi:hypothetical protein